MKITITQSRPALGAIDFGIIKTPAEAAVVRINPVAVPVVVPNIASFVVTVGGVHWPDGTYSYSSNLDGGAF